MKAGSTERPRLERARETLEILRLFRAEKHDPEPYYRRLAARTIRDLPLPVARRDVLDLGCGSGHLTDALRCAGAVVTPVDVDDDALGARTEPLTGMVVSDGRRLAFADATFDGVMCSNVLEHTEDPSGLLHEIGRVVRPGGWAWVSWTNWYSPWGGHEIVPFHYLGPRLGPRAWRGLFGTPRKNVPYDGLWPTYIGQILRIVDELPTLSLRESMPRYYPSQRWITRVPGIREVLTWNCVLILQRTSSA